MGGLLSTESRVVLAAKNDNLPKLKALVKRGHDIRQTGDDEMTALHFAAVNDNIEMAEYILSMGADIEARDNAGHTPLFLATLIGNSSIVEFLLGGNADANTRRADHRTPMHVAASLSYTDILIKLVEYEGIVDEVDHSQWSPLVIACALSSVETVTLLIESGADVNLAGGESNDLPMTIAVNSDREEVVALLVARGVDIEQEIYASKITHLRLACRLGYPRVVKTLLDHGADINKTTRRGYRLLDAVRSPDKAMVAALVASNYDLEERNVNGHTCLILAAILGNADAVATFVDSGANVNREDTAGVTPLTHATRGVSRTSPEDTMKHWKIAVMLAKKGANGEEAYARFPALQSAHYFDSSPTHWMASRRLHTKIHDSRELARLVLRGAHVDDDSKIDGYTPLMRACHSNTESAAVVLLDAGASTVKRGSSGLTPVLVCGMRGSNDVLKILIQKGVDISAVSIGTYPSLSSKILRRPLLRGYNALMLACVHGHEETVSLLVKNGINLDELEEDGNTALHISVANNRPVIVRTLIVAGARVNIKNKEGLSPSDMAASLRPSGVQVEEALLFGGAITDLRSMNHLGRDLSTTFNNIDLMQKTYTISAMVGSCANIDHVRLKDGRCVHMATRPARERMMKFVNKEVEPDKFVFPLQISGTCWFYATLAAFFVSDLCRYHTLPLRRAMIMGRKTVSGERFLAPAAEAFLKLNVLIQTIISGNSADEPVRMILPILQNEEVVVALHESGITQRGLNCGWGSIQFIESLVSRLSGNDGQIRLPSIPHGDSTPSIYVKRFTATIPFRTTIDGRVYTADSVAIIDHGHVISGLTIGGERCIYDSNRGRIEIDWKDAFDNPDKTFKVMGAEYSFRTATVYVFYCLPKPETAAAITEQTRLQLTVANLEMRVQRRKRKHA